MARNEFDALMKELYTQPLIQIPDEDFMARSPYGSRVDDTQPPPEPEKDEYSGLFLRTSRKVPPGVVMAIQNQSRSRAQQLAELEEYEREMRRRMNTQPAFSQEARRQLDEARRRLDDEVRQQLIGSPGRVIKVDADKDAFEAMYVGTWPDAEPPAKSAPAPRAKPLTAQARGKRRISLTDE